MAAIICWLTLSISFSYAQSWQPLGPDESEQVYPGACGGASLCLKGNTPYIALHADSKVIVRRLTASGRTWEQVGNYLFYDQTNTPLNINIKIDGEIIYVAYYSLGTIYIKKLQVGASVWETVGETTLPKAQVQYMSMELNNHTPYIVYQNVLAGSKLTVVRLSEDGTRWETVGNANFSQNKASFPSLAFYNRKPYVAYQESSVDTRLRLMRLNDAETNWESLAITRVGGGFKPYVSLAFYGSIPCVAFCDDDASNKLSVIKYNETKKSFEALGKPGFTLGSVSNIVMKSNNGSLYIAYSDNIQNGRLSVVKLGDDGMTWVGVGNQAFTGGSANGISLEFEDTKPILAYQDVGYINRVSVSRLNDDGSEWKKMNTTAFTPGTAITMKMVDDGTHPYLAYVDYSKENRLSVTCYSKAISAWENVGVSSVSKLGVTRVDIAMNGVQPYVYYDESDRATVKRLSASGDEWELVGNSNFTGVISSGTKLSMTLNGKVPYVAYQDFNNTDKGVVMRLNANATAWEVAGNAYFTPRTTKGITLAADQGVVYAGYYDANTYNVVIMRLNAENNVWEKVVEVPFNSGRTVKISALKFYQSSLYLLYEDSIYMGLYKFNDAKTSWSSVGKRTLYNGAGNDATLAFYGNTPYVACTSSSEGKQLVVRLKADGSDWEDVYDNRGISSDRILNTGLSIINGDLIVAYECGGVFAKSTKISAYLTDVQPLINGSGKTVTLTGGNLTGTTAVSFGGVPAASFQVVSSTVITAVVGKGASGDIQVVAPAGTATFAGFEFVSAPSIISISPASGGAGTKVTLTGTNLTSTTRLTLGGYPVTSFKAESATTLTTVLDKNVSSGVFTVTTPGGTASSQQLFTYYSPPVLTSASVMSAKAGTAVTLTGNNLSTVTAVSFGGVPAASFRLVSASSIAAVVGDGASGDILVTNAGGSTALSGFAFISEKPTITSISETKAGYGSTVLIKGTNFKDATGVSFGGVSAQSFVINTSELITAVLGKGASGTITVATSKGTASYDGFVFVNAPVIQSFTPASAVAGTRVTINGSYLTGVTNVTFGGKPAANFRVETDNIIIATVGDGASGTVEVSGPVGKASLPNFTFIPPPEIVSFAPSTAGENSQITITGNNFYSVQDVVFGNTRASSFKVNSPTSITATVGPAANGSVYISTSTGDARLSGFRFIQKPAINADGPLTFAKGGKVKLQATEGQGYVYEWLRNGVVAPNSSNTVFTATESGTYQAKLTVDGYITETDPVQVKVQYVLPAGNFKVSAIDVSCKGQANGAITITAVQPLNYIVALTGNSMNKVYSFNQQLNVPSLTAGSYSLCITVQGEAEYQRCFDLKIAEPKDLAVYTVLNKENNMLNVNLQGGTEYTLTINGSVYHTSGSTISLPLNSGSNRLMVSTNQPCQGIVERIINDSGNRTPYPNPVEHVLYINIGEDIVPSTEINIYSTTNGSKVWSTRLNNSSGVVQLDVSSIAPGIYSMQLLQGKAASVFKVIKK